MSKFERGDWVRHVREGHRGMVASHRARGVLVRWVGSHKAEPVATRSLASTAPPRALVLEGALDDHLESTRSEEDLLRTWLGANNVPFAYKSILTLEDIAVIGRALGAKQPLFVHLSCHGDYDDSGRAYIRLAPGSRKSDRIFMDDDAVLGVFRDAFGGLPLLLSACQLGRFEGAMQAFRTGARLTGVAAFARDVYDSEAMLFELLLYQGLLVNGWTFRTAAEKARDALYVMGLRGGTGRGQAFVRVC
jgi:hypothetical protein